MSSAHLTDHLRLRPGLAVIVNEGKVYLRAGDEDIFVLEGDFLGIARQWLVQLSQGLSVRQIRAEVQEDEQSLWDEIVQQLDDMRSVTTLSISSL